MWLLNVHTRRLESFSNEREVPNGYAILSHTWETDEVTFQDVEASNASRKLGYRKIDLVCRQSIVDGLSYAWVDTCCIDKKSSAELSEAINSMYRWYGNAKICYVYLCDIEVTEPIDSSGWSESAWTASAFKKNDQPWLNSEQWKDHFSRCHWFTRGWTLQELIAPLTLNFYDRDWQIVGTKSGMAALLSQITGIDTSTLDNRPEASSTSVARRMSWAAHRSTSREEDQAYSLLGIFGVNMPLLYGEGARAFLRLQEEIIRSSTSVDHSILAWKPWWVRPQTKFQSVRMRPHSKGSPDIYQPLLSPSPYGFRHANNIVSWSLPHNETFELSRRGLQMNVITKRPSTFKSVHLAKSLLGQDWNGFSSSQEDILAIGLNCRYSDRPRSRILLVIHERPRVDSLQRTSKSREDPEDAIYDRMHIHWDREHFSDLALADMYSWSKQMLTLAKEPFAWPGYGNKVEIILDPAFRASVDSSPECTWNKSESTLTLAPIWSDRLGRHPCRGALEVTGPSSLQNRQFLIVELAPKASPQDNKESGILVQVSETLPMPEIDVSTVEWMARPHAEDWTTMASGSFDEFTLSDESKLRVSAKYLDMAGEMLWSLNTRWLTSDRFPKQERFLGDEMDT